MKIRKYRKNHIKKGRSGTATVPGMKGIVTVLILCILLVLTGCGNDQIHKTNEKISSENKQYMDSLINESKGMEKVDVKKKPGKIIHATRYEADVELDTVNKVISGRSVIYFRNDSDDAVDSVVLRNYSAVGDDSVIDVALPETLEPGGKTKVTYDFEYDIPERRNRYGYVEYEDRTLFQLSSCFPAAAIYEDGDWNRNPCISDGAEANYTTVSDYDVRISVPKEYTVIATGSEKRVDDSHYEVKGKNLREFAMVAGDHLKKKTTEACGIELNNYYYDDSGSQKYVDYSLQVMKASVELYSELIGEYPFEQLDLTNVFIDSAMEYSGMIMLGFPDVEDIRYIDESTRYEHIKAHVSHETGHQWFYGVVGNDPYNEPWLDESFAEFLECFVFPVSGAEVLTDIEDELSREQGEYYEPGLQTVSDFFDEKDQILEQRDHKKKIDLPYDRYDKSNDEYSQYVYDSGAFFLYELEKTMGDAEFFSMLQGYYDTYRFSEVTTSDFVSFVKTYDDSESVDKVISKYITDM